MYISYLKAKTSSTFQIEKPEAQNSIARWKILGKRNLITDLQKW